MASIKISLLLLCIISIFFAAGCVQSDDKEPVSPVETPSEQPATDVTEYVACGCGCCGGAEEVVKCLYRSKGDDIQKIIDDDQKAAKSSDCPLAGCSQPIKYIYCDEEINTEINSSSGINKDCNTDSDCTLLLCTGCVNKEWAKASPPEPPCATYADYSGCKCTDNRCVEIF